MARVEEKIMMLEGYLANKDKYIPLVDHAWKQYETRSVAGDVNIGWDVGIVEGNRPYFCECWASGYTVLTYFISTTGIEDYGIEQIEDMLSSAGIVRYKLPRKYITSVQKFYDGNDNQFFSINIIVGDDEGTYVEGGNIFGFSSLNEFNRNR